MIRLLATTALGLVLASAAFAQSTNSKTEPTQRSQSNSAPPSTTSPPAQSQPAASQPQQSPSSGSSTQNTQANTAPSGSADAGTSNTSNSANSSSPPQSGTASSNTNQPPSQQGANPPATNTNQAQDRSNPPPSNTNQAQQAPAPTGTGQAQQTPNASGSNQAQGERAGTNAQAEARADVKIDKQQETKISASISHLNVRPVTNANFSLSVGTVVPRDVQLSTLPPDVVQIVPQYRGYSFALVKDEIVVVDPATYKIVTVLPYSGQSTAATTTTRERSKFSDRDREVIRKHAKTRVEGRTTGSTARTEIHVGDRVPESVEVDELPTEVYRDAPDLREYRYIHRDTRTYVVEPHERRVIEEIE